MFNQKSSLKWLSCILLLQASTLVSLVNGQSHNSDDYDSLCERSDQIVQVRNQDDINRLAACRTFSGTLSINSTIQGGNVQMNYIEKVKGDILIYNVNDLRTIELSALRSVTGTLKIDNNPQLSNIILSKLTEVNTTIFNGLPSIQSLQFPSVLQEIRRIDVTDTSLSTLDGINATSIDEINIAGNKKLNDIRLSHVQSIGKSFYVSKNGDKLSLNLGSLQEIQSGTFESLQDIQLNGLQTVNGGLYFYNNQMRSIDLSNVTQWPGALSIENNANLETVRVTKLEQLGGAITIKNNNRLVFADVFPELSQVGGSMELTGTFNDINLPNLHDVEGGFIAKSSNRNFSCDKINDFQHRQIVKGHSFSCAHDSSLPSNAVILSINIFTSVLLAASVSFLFIS
ncbi:unnamed protein product [Cunninghamella blakesleeana]